jgi:hypothetical protein
MKIGWRRGCSLTWVSCYSNCGLVSGVGVGSVGARLLFCLRRYIRLMFYFNSFRQFLERQKVFLTFNLSIVVPDPSPRKVCAIIGGACSSSQGHSTQSYVHLHKPLRASHSVGPVGPRLVVAAPGLDRTAKMDRE